MRLTMGAHVIILAVMIGLVCTGLTGCGGGDQGLTSVGDEQFGDLGEADYQVPWEEPVMDDGDALDISSPLVEPLQIGSNRRLAVVRECWYALRRSYLGRPNEIEGPHDPPSISNCTVSSWNYIASDTGAFNHVRRRFGSNSSVCKYFGLADSYGRHGGYGRGGQCFFFSALIVRRARGVNIPCSYSSLKSGGKYGRARYAVPGDIIFKPNYHVAVVVKDLGSSLDVVDSNWIGYGDKRLSVGTYGGRHNSEIIGRHPVSKSSLSSWYLYTGAGRWY